MGEGLGEGDQKIGPHRRLADDGKRFQAMDVVLGLLLAKKFCFCTTRGGVWGRESQTSRLTGGLADDGKRSHALDVVLALLLAENVQNRGGVWGGGVKKSRWGEGWRMTGSASKRWTLYWDCFSPRSFFV